MKGVITISAMILFLMTGCEGNKQSTDNLITVDVIANYPEKELILQDFMDVEYIPLETTDEFITAGNIQVIGKDVIILKNMGRTDGDIFIFDRKGKGLKRVNRLGQGGEEYTNILGITLDEDNDEMLINNHYLKKVIVYDLLGNFKRSFKQKEGTLYDPIGNFDREYLICHDDFFDFDKPDLKRNCFLIVSKQNESIKEIQIPYKEKKSMVIIERDANGKITNNWGIRNKQLIPYQNNWILIEPSADTIYSYSPDHNLKPFIVRTPSVQTMDTEIFLFPSVLTDRYYFMQTVKKVFNFGVDTDLPRINLVYDKQANAIFECIVYNDDFTNKTPVNLWFEHRVLTEVNNDEVTFAKRLEATELVEAYEKGQLKGKLKEIAAGLDEESNPVIMLAKYKHRTKF